MLHLSITERLSSALFAFRCLRLLHLLPCTLNQAVTVSLAIKSQLPCISSRLFPRFLSTTGYKDPQTQLDRFLCRQMRTRLMDMLTNVISATARSRPLIGSINTCNHLRMTSLSFAALIATRNLSLYLDWFSILRASLVGLLDSRMLRGTLIPWQRDSQGCSSSRRWINIVSSWWYQEFLVFRMDFSLYPWLC